MDPDFWNARYGADEPAYGDAPNDFLAEVADRLPPGPALCLGAGEGRNAIFLAGREAGPVAAVDLSRVGLDVAERAAAARGVDLETRVGDLAEMDFGEGWAVITSIWVHVPPPVRARVHAEVRRALAPGGAFVLEAYTPAQVGRGTGGPPTAALMTDLAELRAQLDGLELRVARERERDVREGRFHQGPSSVVQVLAVKPS